MTQYLTLDDALRVIAYPALEEKAAVLLESGARIPWEQSARSIAHYLAAGSR
ncbi:hypothetical protein [Arthrobacter roseus]|uniref:hypothetical protein n=1 Tax=Arthrobacter roseus TaxID=136274 RepID=UPI00196249E5|nr:hypothetical protein [Arthrobacter roseus]MBM7846861.1 hypothetical protein [Arthrobacter roseus]